jgi:hypothetical protein
MNRESLKDLTWLKDCIENKFGVKIQNTSEFYVYLVKLSNSIIFNYQFPSEIRDSIARVNRRLNKFSNAFDYFANQVVDEQSGGGQWDESINALNRVQTKFSQTLTTMFDNITQLMNRTFERDPNEIMNKLKQQIDTQKFSCDTGQLAKTLLQLRSLVNIATYDVKNNFNDEFMMDKTTHDKYVLTIGRLEEDITKTEQLLKQKRGECSRVLKMTDKIYEYIAEVLKIMLYIRKIETEQRLQIVRERASQPKIEVIDKTDCTSTKLQLLSRLEMALDDIRIIQDINTILRMFKEKEEPIPDFIGIKDIKQMNEINKDTIEKYVSQIEKFDDINTKEGCDKLVKLGNELMSKFPNHVKIRNYYEDLQGSIRTYVRITNIAKIKNQITGRKENDERPSITLDTNNCKMIVKDDYMKKLFTRKKMLGSDNIHLIRRFYGTYDNMNNVDVYTSNLTCSPSLQNAIQQVRDGYSIILLLYGYSGSGKTYTLLGDVNGGRGSQLGLLQLSIRSMVEHISKIDMTVKMLYGVKSVGSTLEISSNRPDPNILESMDEYKTSNLTIGSDFENGIVKIVNDVQDYMKEQNYIKWTPFNKYSSRSHTFYILNIHFKDGKIGFLTFADLAGSEDPFKIIQQNLDRIDVRRDDLTGKYQQISEDDVRSRIRNLIFSVKSLKERSLKFDQYTSKRGQLSIDQKELLNSLIDESVYINESLNQMKYFLLKRITMKPKVVPNVRTNYNIHGLIYPPINRDRKTIIDDRTGMYSLLSELDKKGIITSLRQTFSTKPTKFILIGTVRTETIPIYVDGTFNTISFLNKLNIDKSPETIVNENIQRKRMYGKYYEEAKLPTSEELSRLLSYPVGKMKDEIRTKFTYFNSYIQQLISKTTSKNDKQATEYVKSELAKLNIDDLLQEKILQIYTRYIPSRTYIPSVRSSSPPTRSTTRQRGGKHRSSRQLRQPHNTYKVY